MSGCAEICISGYDGDSTFFREKYVIARKAHRCTECHRTIEKGQRYHRAGGRCEGEFWSDASCLVCDEIRRAFACRDEGIMIGALWDRINDEMFPEWGYFGPWDCLAKLTTQEARDFVMAHFRESIYYPDGDR